jgi:hypothetical protein
MAGSPLTGAVRYTLPQFVWGAALDKTLEVGHPFDRATTYPDPAPGLSTMDRRVAAERDVSSRGVDFLIDLTINAIPGVSLVSGRYMVPVAGWDSADGWRDFLQWAMNPRHVFHLLPTRDLPLAFWRCRLRHPTRDDEQPVADPFRFTRQLSLTLVNADGVPFTGY